MTDQEKYGKPIANFILNDLKGILNKRKLSFDDCPLAPEVIGFLVRASINGQLDKRKIRPLVEKWIDENVKKRKENSDDNNDNNNGC